MNDNCCICCNKFEISYMTKCNNKFDLKCIVK